MLRKKYIPLLLSIALAITSCSKDFLETTPTDAISEKDALATAENMSRIIDGLHRFQYAQPQTLIPGSTSARSGNHYWVPLGDNMSGGVIHSARANNLGWQDELQWISHTQEFSNTSEQLWYQRYHVIGSVNKIINAAAIGNIPEDERLREVLGQAHTYRAFAYFSLVTHYARGYLIGNPQSDAGVPILFTTESPFTSEPRSTVQQVYDQILDDLDTAITYFENATQRSPSRREQLNINVAYGLLARVALSMGDWQTAADAAVEARAGFRLMNEAEYKSGFNSFSLPEVIWGSEVIETETVFFRSYFYWISNDFQGSQIRNNPKIIDRRLYNQIPDTDYRKDLFLADAPNTNTSAANGEGGFGNDPNYTDEDLFNQRDAEIRATYNISSRHNLHPYMHVKFRQETPGTNAPDDIIYMRSSEMYLIEAEAHAMLGNIGPAQAALDVLGSARDSNYDASIYNTQSALMDHIKFQRGVELWGEGFLYTDKIRWDEGIDHAADGGSGASQVLYQAGFQQERPSVNNEWIFKIPQREIDANPNLTNNDQN
ncbi:RagB/SusD family nutrient uptake outer membrane protein [Ascidiimonas aurantiaca]|uniref:RagB/SusD family nutrient uptake outer membrane protein n=1 Tax=Ascidiimonas aurantiaca TaxID=1685432 RepID=UPI0030EF65F1